MALAELRFAIYFDIPGVDDLLCRWELISKINLN
jgi:hypothetical protein